MRIFVFAFAFFCAVQTAFSAPSSAAPSFKPTSNPTTVLPTPLSSTPKKTCTLQSGYTDTLNGFDIDALKTPTITDSGTAHNALTDDHINAWCDAGIGYILMTNQVAKTGLNMNNIYHYIQDFTWSFSQKDIVTLKKNMNIFVNTLVSNTGYNIVDINMYITKASDQTKNVPGYYAFMKYWNNYLQSI